MAICDIDDSNNDDVKDVRSKIITIDTQVCAFLEVCMELCILVSGYIWICVLDYSKSISKVRFQDLSGLSPLVKIY